jgi:hypothetical protein
MAGCERCGRLDTTLRAATFLYTISLLVVTFRRPAGGIYCKGCRRKQGLKYTAISAVLGWWGIPWGPLYTIQAIGRNSAGGYQDAEFNAQILRWVAAEMHDKGDRNGAAAALEESLRLHDDGEVQQLLWALQGEISTGQALAGDAAEALTTHGKPLTSHFTPGAMVRPRYGHVTLYAQPDDSGEPVAMLESESAVVTRVEHGWLELQVPGGSSGWALEAGIEAAA